MNRMNRFPYLLFLLALVSVGLSNSYAAQDDFGLSTTIVTTSTVKKVKKNIGKLRILISTDCHASAEDASQMIQTVKNDIQGKAESEFTKIGMEGVALDENSSVENLGSASQYRLRYPQKNSQTMVYIDNCSEKHISLNGLNIDQINELNAKKIYSSALTMTYVTKDRISKLLELKQFLADVVSEFNEAYKDENGTKAGFARVYMPTFDIDDATQDALKEELNTQLDLNSQETQISVDETFFKKFTGAGFTEKYINTDENANITYSQIRPHLLEDGSVRLQKTFYFTLSYSPTNFGVNADATSKVHSKSFNIDTEMKLQESDVESYLTVINVSTKCQQTRADANKVFKAAFKKAKEAAEEVLKDVPSGLNVVRINRVQSPQEGHNDQSVARRWVMVWEDTRWLDRCTGEVVLKNQRKKYWEVAQSFKILTSSYVTYQKLKELAEQSVGEADKDDPYLARQQHPIVRPTNSPVVLKSEPWRKAVDAQLYEQALYKLTDPAGPVAKHLNSKYVKATKAYYSLGQETVNWPWGGEEDSDERLHQPPGKAYDGERLIVDDSNLDPHQETAARSYTIIWKPVHDLMTVIKARAKQDTNTSVLR